jgi:hypothetical protein
VPKTYTSDPRAARSFAKRMYEVARTNGLDAEKAGAKGWRLDSTLALTAYYTGDATEAYARAAAAVRALPPGDISWTSLAVLQVFAESRWKAIKALVREQKQSPRTPCCSSIRWAPTRRSPGTSTS